MKIRAKSVQKSHTKSLPADTQMTRRDWVKSSALMGGGLGVIACETAMAQSSPKLTPADYRIQHGRIKQSIMGWTYNPMPTLELARLCKEIGLVAMEGVDAKFYPQIRELGLAISLVGSHGFSNGPFNPANHQLVEAKLREGIDLAVKYGSKGVITFTGMREKGISDEQGRRHCVESWKRVIGYAEKHKINLVLEHLNSRDNTHPMKGHPGYYGDNVDLCVELIREVGSPNMKLLFDIYHVQIMHGDVIRRLRLYKDVIGHIHTAGVPGRAELDDSQEINYPAVMKTILDIGFEGYVAQEFIPTWEDRALALRHAARICDV